MVQLLRILTSLRRHNNNKIIAGAISKVSVTCQAFSISDFNLICIRYMIFLLPQRAKSQMRSTRQGHSWSVRAGISAPSSLPPSSVPEGGGSTRALEGWGLLTKLGAEENGCGEEDSESLPWGWLRECELLFA